MKNFTLLFTAMMLALSVSAQQVPKRPLIEHFTQASCVYCPAQNSTLQGTLNAFGSGNYVKLTYQTSSPGYDPMNIDYPVGSYFRGSMHGITGVPNTTMNGSSPDAPNTIVTAATLNAAAALMSDLELTATHSYGSGRDINVEITIKNVGSSTITAGKKLISAMTEREISYATAPGTNGEKEFFQVVRNMYNASNGASDLLGAFGATLPAMNAGDSITYNFTAVAPTYIRRYDEIGFAFFVEDGSAGDVLQSTYSEPIPITAPLDVSTSNSVIAATIPGYCDNTLTPSFDITNTKATPITSIQAEYSIAGGTGVPVTVSGLSLAQGQTATVSFPAITLPAGNNKIVYSITGLNGGNPDYSSSNNTDLQGSRVVLSKTAVAKNITTTFENLPLFTSSPANSAADNPEDIRAYTVDSSLTKAATWLLGGFGKSEVSFRWDFYAIDKNKSSKLVYEKIDLTDTSANVAWLKWSTAYAQYTTEQDRLEVKVSTDCGITWTSLYSEAGADLATAPACNPSRFYPKATDWRTDSVDLTPYLTSTDLMIAFVGTGATGNSLYIDDIRTETATQTNVNSIQAPTTSFSVFPNPVRNILNLNFEVANPTDLNISIKNALGQTVQQVANQNFLGTTTLTVDTKKLPAGVYFVNAINNNSVITKRFVIEH